MNHKEVPRKYPCAGAYPEEEYCLRCRGEKSFWQKLLHCGRATCPEYMLPP